MAFAIACSKLWEPKLVEKLQAKISTPIILITDKSELTKENLEKHNVRKIFFPHWSYIIKPEIFNQFECVIFHMTDLPYGRGGSPLQNLIVRGHKNTRISALKCSAGIDTGPVYIKRDLELEGTAQIIFERATKIIEDMIVELIEKNPTPVEQSGEVTTFERRKPEEGSLSNVLDLNSVFDYIRMLDAVGYPNAFIENDKVRYEFHSVQWNGDELEAKVRIIKK